MEKGISYLNRTYADYKQALIEYSKKYFPDFNTTYDDASVASWIIGLNAAVADDLSYHIDRVYQETSLDSANQKSSLYNIARNNGVKIPGPKGAMAEVRFSCTLPVDMNGPDWKYAPVIKRGSRVSSSTQQFEVMDDIDFASQFNSDGVSDRLIRPNLSTNGIVTGYTVSKLSVVVAGETRIYRTTVAASDVKPFMEVLLPITGIMNVESIIVQDGTNASVVPSYGEFYSDREEVCSDTDKTKRSAIRFFEVDNLAQTERWGDAIGDDGRALKYRYGYNNNGTAVETYCITKGEWRPVEHKFITEYTDKGYLKVIFGASNGQNVSLGEGMSDFGKWQISRIMNNKTLGILPEAGTTIFILYRLGGGASSNVAAGGINKISYLDAQFRSDPNASSATDSQDKVNMVKRSLAAVNVTPSVSGKDMPSNEELKYLIKYYRAAQERCVTVKDYIDRILNLPPKYGTPFRVGVMEENNKIMVYLLGINDKGHLDTLLPVTLVKNIERYLDRFRMINDFVEIKSGRIINVSFDVDIIVSKDYNKADVVNMVIETIRRYMDINAHIMGEELYMGDLEKEISKVDGVINLIDLRVYNETGAGYSMTQIGQPTIADTAFTDDEEGPTAGRSGVMIDLDATDGILYNDGDSMIELKYPSQDIRVRIKER